MYWERAIRGIDTALSNLATELDIQTKNNSSQDIIDNINKFGELLTAVKTMMEDMLTVF